MERRSRHLLVLALGGLLCTLVSLLPTTTVAGPPASLSDSSSAADSVSAALPIC